MSESGKKPTPAQLKVLEAMNDSDRDFGFFHFKTLCKRTRLKRAEVRRLVRALARKGLTEYGKGLWYEDGGMAGSGYRITDLGRTALRKAEGH